MTQYLLSVHGEETDSATGGYMSEEEMQTAFAQVNAFNEELQSSGAWVFAGGLMPASTSTVVDATGSDVVTTDGPYLESKEHIGGFWVVEAPDLDAALELARKGSAACMAKVEVRPFQGE